LRGVLYALVAYPLTGAVVGLIAGRAGVVLALAAMSLPFFVPEEHTLVRLILTLGTGLFLIRAIDLARDSRRWPMLDRVWLMFAMWDVRERRQVPRALELRALLSFLGYASLVAMGIGLVVWVAPAVESPFGLALRWLGGAFIIYGAADVSNSFLVMSLGLGGIRPPPQHDAPVLARTVREFWAERWNINIHAWLRRHTFLPLARRGHRRSGIVAGFAASALLHFWLVAVPIGIAWAIPMGLFFLVQGAFALVETRLRIVRWARPWQHAWTVVALLGSSPLFVEPMLRVFAT
jgi:hypothetical protein